MKNVKIGSLLQRFAALFMVAMLTGCHTLPQAEYQDFTPVSPEKRIMNQVKISWEVRDDVAEFCAKAKGMSKDAAFLTPPIACAMWNSPRKECTVVTGSKTSHTALGHEVRHCFEGHFH